MDSCNRIEDGNGKLVMGENKAENKVMLLNGEEGSICEVLVDGI